MGTQAVIPYIKYINKVIKDFAQGKNDAFQNREFSAIFNSS